MPYRLGDPLIDFKHKSINDFRNMTTDQIYALDPKKIGYYQMRDITTDNGFTQEQIDAFDVLLKKKTEMKLENTPSAILGGKTRKNRKYRKGKKGGKKSRKSRKGSKSRK
jgi:hypothetical protein